MGYISSINFKKSTSFQVFHNANIRPNYAIGGELTYTLKGYEALKLKEKIIQEAKEAYERNKKPKAPNFKAQSYEWSAVVNLKPESTMQDLEKLSEYFFQEYGFQCYQIAIHRDEGYINEQGQKEINHHAHLEFITLDKETGKSVFRAELQRPKALRKMQSEVAEILGMQRGEDKRLSGRQRIEPRKYAQMKEVEKRERKELINQTLSQKEIKAVLEDFRKQSIGKGYPKEFFRELSDLKQNTKEATLEDLKNILEDLAKGYESEKNERELLEQELENIKNEKSKLELEIKALKSDLRAISDTQNDKQIEPDDINQKINQTKQELATLTKKSQDLDFIKHLNKNKLTDDDKIRIIQISENFIIKYGGSVWLDYDTIKNKNYAVMISHLKEELPKKEPNITKIKELEQTLAELSKQKEALEANDNQQTKTNNFKDKLKSYTQKTNKPNKNIVYNRI